MFHFIGMADEELIEKTLDCAIQNCFQKTNLSILALIDIFCPFSGIHIRPHPYDHSCHEDPLEKLKHELEESLSQVHREEMNHIKVPSKSNIVYKSCGEFSLLLVQCCKVQWADLTCDVTRFRLR